MEETVCAAMLASSAILERQQVLHLCLSDMFDKAVRHPSEMLHNVSHDATGLQECCMVLHRARWLCVASGAALRDIQRLQALRVHTAVVGAGQHMDTLSSSEAAERLKDAGWPKSDLVRLFL